MASRASLAVLFSTVFVDLVGFGIVIPLIAVYGRHYGASPLELAVLGAGFSVMQFLFAPLWGSLSDRVGRRPIILMSLAGSTISYVFFGLAESYEVLLISRLFAGFFAANISAAEAYISDVTPPEKRTSGMGVIGAAFGLGFILGPPIGGMSAHWLGLSAPGFVAAAICGINLVLAYFRLAESLPPERRGMQRRSWVPLAASSLRQVAEIPCLPWLLTISFFWIVALAHLEQCFALLLQERFFGATEDASFSTGTVLGWSGFIGACIQGLWLRKLEKRVKPIQLLVWGLALAVITYALFPYVPTFKSYYIIALPLAFSGSFASPSVSALISLQVPADRRGVIFGVSQSFGSLARALAPFSAQLAFGVYYGAPFLMAAMICLAMLLLASRLRRNLETMPA